MARRLNPNSDAWGGAWGSASAWGGTWGWSWSPIHEVDELRRPRTNPNIRLRQIKDVRHKLVGCSDVLSGGTIHGRVRRPVAQQRDIRARISGRSEYDSAGVVRARAGSRRKIGGCSDNVASGRVVGRAGARRGISGLHPERDYESRIRGHAGGCAAVRGATELDGCSGFDYITVIKNPTDEELVLITLDLTKQLPYNARKY